MPLVTSQGYNLGGDPAGALGRGFQLGQQIRGAYDQRKAQGLAQELGSGQLSTQDQEKKMATLFSLNPQLAGQLTQKMGFDSQEKINEAANWAFSTQQLPAENRKDAIMSRAQKLESEGRNASDTLSLLELTPEQQDQALTGTQLLALPHEKRLAIAKGRTNLSDTQREWRQYNEMPESTETERNKKVEFGKMIGAISKNMTLEEKLKLEEGRSEIAIKTAGGKEEAKIEAETKGAPRSERVVYLSKNLPNFEADIAASQSALNEIDRAIEIWESAPGTISGPLMSRAPSLTANSQELESILAGLGIERLSSFKGATSERELATAFRAGASIEQDKVAGIRRLKKQKADIERNNARLLKLANEARALLEEKKVDIEKFDSMSDDDLMDF